MLKKMNTQYFYNHYTDCKVTKVVVCKNDLQAHVSGTYKGNKFFTVVDYQFAYDHYHNTSMFKEVDYL